MCRLFALHAGRHDVSVEFWLLDAPVSMARQSEFNADGFGMAALTARRAMMLFRNPMQASEDPAYRHIARRLEACEMMVHLRYANTGGTSLLNTHPFSQDGRLFAHNGVVGDLDRIEARLGSNRAMVMGDTDSERLFALVTLRIREAEGDVRAGLTAAVREVVSEFELYSINFLLAELGHFWAFRYPEHNPLHLQRRRPGGPSGAAQLDQSSASGDLRLHSDDGAEAPLVLIASERISDEPGWEEIRPGELVHVGPDLQIDRETIVSGSPRHPMRLTAEAQESQS
ncbi:MAG: class II glutamine amidotransferase, partial [Solirubrobacterales bacterium]|nr:class II glutamine amidotransferase [Solirubrobacterales bacterium]